LYNSQPWLFRLHAGAVEIRVDPSRRLGAADRSGWAARVACGAAAFNAGCAAPWAGPGTRRSWSASVTAPRADPRPAGRDWLIAGEALSAGWLTATERGLAVLPLSIVTEVAGSRDRIRAVLHWAANPQLVIRLATAGGGSAWPTPRLFPSTVVSPLRPPDRHGRAAGIRPCR